jgi:hypothetical protein
MLSWHFRVVPPLAEDYSVVFLKFGSVIHTDLVSRLCQRTSPLFLKSRVFIRHWWLTLSVLNNQSHWQQLLSSWQDVQTGDTISVAEAFADMALLEAGETEGACYDE